MPSAAARQFYEDQIPTFMSVFDLDSEAVDDHSSLTIIEPNLVGMDPQKMPTQPVSRLGPNAMAPDPIHKHNGSTSTQASESAESSPTTTLSCTDSSSLSDPSPSSSPESPVNLPPLSSFTGTSFGGLSSTMAGLTAADSVGHERPMTSPAPRRARNMKGLSIQPPFNSLSNSLVSEPSSPSFIKPKIPAMKRKPSQLSLKTNSSDLATRNTLETPSSPSVPPILQRRALKHSTSSPHMLSSIKSATFSPAGGMTIPTVLERNESGLSEFLRPSKQSAPAQPEASIPEEDSPIRPQVANRAAFEFEPYREQENNEDHKTPGYPDGPIAIYGDDVYLYLEPTAEEASRFDVVINVAREVHKPFFGSSGAKETKEENASAPSEEPADDSPIPDTALTAVSYATAFEFQPTEEEEGSAETPTTPKAMPLKEPEYIHMPWDHNTDISVDLANLCETIERRTKEGKKVLVHCQQGASRSASLIIAYGMWLNPALSVNDAYYAAQARSKWISPNMRLMYCLQDFQKEVSGKKLLPSSGLKSRTGRSPTKHRATLSADAVEIPPKEPHTAPLPNEDPTTDDAAAAHKGLLRPRGLSTPNQREPISPGPSSAPPSLSSWSEKEDADHRGRFGRSKMDSTLSPPPLLQPPPSQQQQQQPTQKPKPKPKPKQLRCASVPPRDVSRPQGSFRLAPPPLLKPPPSPGFAPVGAFSKPPPSPGFAPIGTFSKPAPSPGFGSHRFGGQSGGFGLLPLNPSSRHETPEREVVPERHVRVMRSFPDDAALMSPRAETMTASPLQEPFDNNFASMRFVEVPPTPGESLFSPRESLCPRDPFQPFGRPTQSADPRSPPTKGETPIIRSIDEVL